MLGLLLMAVAVVFEETATSIGKWELRKKLETPYAYGTLVTLAVLLGLGVSALLRWDAQVFRWEGMPLFLIRLPLEMLLAVCIIYAIQRADRSTFGFLRTLTIPFLLVVDMVLGYPVDALQIIGISLIVLAVFLLFINHGFSKHGAWLTAMSALLAVVTVSLYKYNITYFNSPEVEQGMMFLCLFFFFLFMGFFYERKNPFRLLRYPACIAQGVLIGTGGVFSVLSFLYATPSLLMSVKRAGGVFATIVSGGTFFHEKRLLLKVSVAALTTAGLVLLIF